MGVLLHGHIAIVSTRQPHLLRELAGVWYGPGQFPSTCPNETSFVSVTQEKNQRQRQLKQEQEMDDAKMKIQYQDMYHERLVKEQQGLVVRHFDRETE